jgi:sigma-B regulation protein RsbU (phosphoserine phosphatase)
MARGDALALVTDGATEAMSPTGEELGDAGVCRALQSSRAGSAGSMLAALLESVHTWTGPAGCSDDLTAVILKAEEK